MRNFSAAIGDIAAPILFMLFVGYQVGKYSDRMALSIILCVVLGVVVSMVNVWKLMKKLRSRDND